MSKAKLKVRRPNSIIIGIYGCTTSMKYANEDLYTYIDAHLQEYLTEHWGEKKLTRIVDRIEKMTILDIASGVKHVPPVIHSTEPAPFVKSLVANIRWRMTMPVYKYSPIITLWDWIWAEGYLSGKLKSHVFDDVPEALIHWRMHLFIKLFGIAAADISGQKLFFQSTIKGDVTKNFNNYVQFTLENKKETVFYRILCRLVRDEPANILFLTANIDEALAAKSIGLPSIIVMRPGNDPISPEELGNIPTIQSFDQIEFEEDPSNPPPCC